jgi:hypothetical protein
VNTRNESPGLDEPEAREELTPEAFRVEMVRRADEALARPEAGVSWDEVRAALARPPSGTS